MTDYAFIQLYSFSQSAKSKVFGHPVYGNFLGWENHFSTLGLGLKSVNVGPSPQF